VFVVRGEGRERKKKKANKEKRLREKKKKKPGEKSRFPNVSFLFTPSSPERICELNSGRQTGRDPGGELWDKQEL